MKSAPERFLESQLGKGLRKGFRATSFPEFDKSADKSVLKAGHGDLDQIRFTGAVLTAPLDRCFQVSAPVIADSDRRSMRIHDGGG